jgi:hypothetical protein
LNYEASASRNTAAIETVFDFGARGSGVAESLSVAIWKWSFLAGGPNNVSSDGRCGAGGVNGVRTRKRRWFGRVPRQVSREGGRRGESCGVVGWQTMRIGQC